MSKVKAIQWIEQERAYSTAKWPEAKSDAATHEGFEAWNRWLLQYLDRVRLIGIDTPNGQQALGKFVTVAVAMLDSVHRVYGPLPAPGHPSGEVVPWLENPT